MSAQYDMDMYVSDWDWEVLDLQVEENKATEAEARDHYTPDN